MDGLGNPPIVPCAKARPDRGAVRPVTAPPCFSPEIEVAFSPHGGAEARVLKTIESAQKSIRVAAYRFTSKPIALSLLAAHKRGIDVRVVVDKSNATARYTAAIFLANQAVPVRVDYRYAIMHNKFIVVDGESVETGSFNFTSSGASKNAENVVVLHDREVAQRLRAGMG